MKHCPNCSAELTERPCPACGWPETTQRALTLKERLDRARDRELAEDSTERGCCGFIAAFVFSLIAAGFFQIGARNGWTSDGPGMLIIMLGFGFFALLAVTTWTYLVIKPLVRRTYLKFTSYLPAWIRLFIE